ncbi:MAG: fibronectin type III domain-containing protein, partial [Armatimonadota bacterium]
MKFIWFVLIILIYISTVCSAETVRLNATADIWLSDANEQERHTSAGRAHVFKLKSIQEMAAVQFDASQAKGRMVLNATLYLRRAGDDMLRYIMVSTVNGDWVEGTAESSYSPGSGATFEYADHESKRPWAWQGSEFCDVVMSSGNSLFSWAECTKLPDGWISVPLTPELIYAMTTNDTDGLAVIDGGTPSLFNNMIYSAQSPGNEPYIEVELGEPLKTVPSKPIITAIPAPERSGMKHGAIKITVKAAKDAFRYKVALDGNQAGRWQIKHPTAGMPTVFYLEDLLPNHKYNLQVTAVSPGGIESQPAVTVVSSSQKLSADFKLTPFLKPNQDAKLTSAASTSKVWACPGLVKISPETGDVMCSDTGSADPKRSNAVWDGKRISLFGMKGEYVSYQLIVEGPLSDLRILPDPIKGPGNSVIQGTDIELYRNWYAKNGAGQWQPSYCIPMKHGAPVSIPDSQRGMSTQKNQGFYIDLYIPKNAKPGRYRGQVTVKADGLAPVRIPIELTVIDSTLPDRLSFWPELNAYNIPVDAVEYYRLAHQHRCIANYWVMSPDTQRSGSDIKVDWERYDKITGPLLTGEAFKENRRSGVPVECMYLPFIDSWPTPLTADTYKYTGYWPGRGDDIRHISEHYMTAPYIGDALSQDYKNAFHSVQKQFIEHFKDKGYNRTEMQCFYGGKATHRIDYGSNMWWTTDEPYFLDDWLAVQFFSRLWASGLGIPDKKIWAMRADISRPQWQGRMLDGIIDTVYFGTGAFSSPSMYRRCRILAQDSGLKRMTYGSANGDTESNTQSIAWMLNAWVNGADGVLPWQTLGGDAALDINDGDGGGGNALLVPGGRFGLKAVADMRLKSMRDGQQIIEY